MRPTRRFAFSRASYPCCTAKPHQSSILSMLHNQASPICLSIVCISSWFGCLHNRNKSTVSTFFPSLFYDAVFPRVCKSCATVSRWMIGWILIKITYSYWTYKVVVVSVRADMLHGYIRLPTYCNLFCCKPVRISPTHLQIAQMSSSSVVALLMQSGLSFNVVIICVKSISTVICPLHRLYPLYPM